MIHNPVAFIGQAVLGATVGAPLAVDSAGLLASGVSNTSVSATADTTTTSATYVLMDSMTITPVAGTYLVLFDTTVDHSNQSVAVAVGIYVGGSLITDSPRAVITRTNAIGANSCTACVSIHSVVTVNGSQAIEGRWHRSTAGTATAHQRTMSIVRLS